MATPTSAPSASAGAVAAAALSEAAGHALVVNNCLSCHAEEMLAQQRLTSKQWAKVVVKMRGWGAPVEAENVDPLVAYLAGKYGTTAPPYLVPTISPAEATAMNASMSDGPFARGDAKHGRTVYQELCASCHGSEARGAGLGVNLIDRPLLRRAPELARAIRTGRGRMPAFDLKDGEVADLLAHLRSLQ